MYTEDVPTYMSVYSTGRSPTTIASRDFRLGFKCDLPKVHVASGATRHGIFTLLTAFADRSTSRRFSRCITKNRQNGHQRRYQASQRLDRQGRCSDPASGPQADMRELRGVPQPSSQVPHRARGSRSQAQIWSGLAGRCQQEIKDGGHLQVREMRHV